MTHTYPYAATSFNVLALLLTRLSPSSQHEIRQKASDERLKIRDSRSWMPNRDSLFKHDKVFNL